MDFFEHQDKARSQTKVLLLLYILAFSAITVSLYFLFLFLFLNPQFVAEGLQVDTRAGASLWNPELALGTFLGVLTVVGFGSLFKIWQLSSGGAAVAESLGGQLIPNDTQDLGLRRVLNVVEEMALASGVPVPPVYLMEGEHSINAFAAGFHPSDAVVGVTRGCIENLSRDEFQGVMAHEFSHILNGDMRINIRLMGILHGILIIAICGSSLMRIVSRGRYRSRRSSDDGKGTAIIFMLGLGLWIIGYLGVISGRLIKSAVSRQREFLADASAVQFTRNPDGIGGALAKIGIISSGSRIENSDAEEASHMFFSNALSSFFLSVFATHPPIDERVRRINPNFDYESLSFPEQQPAPSSAGDSEHLSSALSSGLVSGAAEASSQPASMHGSAPDSLALQSSEIMSAVGNPSASDLEYTREFLGSLPSSVREAALNPYGARALVYVLLLDTEKAVLDAQLEALAKQADDNVRKLVFSLLDAIATIPRGRYLLILDLCMSSLKQLSEPQREVFLRNVRTLVEADGRVDLFELALEASLERHLSSTSRRNETVRSLGGCREEASILLAAMATISAGQEALALYEPWAQRLGLHQAPPKPNARNFGNALETLDQLIPSDKKILLEAAFSMAAADETLDLAECEFLRACCDGLSCPVPPLLGTRLREI